MVFSCKLEMSMYVKEKSSTNVRSLSGLINYQGLVIGVSDEFYGLFVRSGCEDLFFDFAEATSNGLNYLERKKVKFDHESISFNCIDGVDYLLTFPSLSKSNRDQLGLIKISDPLSFSAQNFAISGLRSCLEKTNRDINVEGHFVSSDILYLLNRGNQSFPNELISIGNANNWFSHVIKESSDDNFVYSVHRKNVDLGSYYGHSLQWTDALFESPSKILFLATIEKTTNSYDDGQVLGSFLGRYDLKENRVLKLKKILDFKKAEGLCIWNSRFLVCIDADSEEMCSEFYSFPLDLLE